MQIGIIGSGNMGHALGVRLARLGHSVYFGARQADKALASAALAGPTAKAGTNDEAVAFGDVLFWTMRENDPKRVLLRPEGLAGKTVVDVNNRDYEEGTRHGVWFEKAIAERLQIAAPNAHVVKAFNTIARDSFDTDPQALREAGGQTFIAGGDAAAKRAVTTLAAELGFEAIDVGSGPLAMRAVEALGDVIRVLMIDARRGGRAHLRLTTLPAPNLSSIGDPQPSSYR
jgi:8-hydroxy-5-deazaflavin:NADPH oxidoreductase